MITMALIAWLAFGALPYAALWHSSNIDDAMGEG